MIIRPYFVSDVNDTGEHAPGQRRVFYGWVIVAAMFAINFSTMATGTLNYGLFILPMQQDLALSRATFGWMQTTRRLATGVFSFAVGWLIDRYGPRAYIPVSAVLICACLMVVSFSSQAWQLILFFGLIGASGLAAPNGIVTSVPVAKWFVRRRGRALALAGAGLGIGGIVLLPVTQWLIDAYGWRGAWRVLALFFLVISVPVAALFLRRQPEDMGLQVDGDPPPDSSDPSSAVSPTQPADPEVMWTVREAFQTGTMWKLIAVFALSGVAQGGASFHRIPYFVEKAYDPFTVSWSFAADAGGAAATSLVAGWLADRIPTRFLAAASFSGFIIAILLMIYVSSVEMMFLSTIVFGCSVGVGMIVHTYIFAAYYGRAFLGTIRGIVMPINLLSAGLGAPLVGYLHDYSGSYLLAWWTLLGIYGCAAALMLMAVPPRKEGEGDDRDSLSLGYNGTITARRIDHDGSQSPRIREDRRLDRCGSVLRNGITAQTAVYPEGQSACSGPGVTRLCHRRYPDGSRHETQRTAPGLFRSRVPDRIPNGWLVGRWKNQQLS